MLIGGVVWCCLVQPNSTSKTFSHALIHGRSSTWSSWHPNEWFRQLCRSWGQNIREHAWVLAPPQHGGLRHNVCYAKIIALQIANYKRHCLNGRFIWRSVFSRMLLMFFVTLYLRFAWVYHVPRDIAIIIVPYHMEVDKLKLKINWSSWIIMVFSFKWLRCNDSHFRMGALKCHQSQLVDTFK
jgi:hypothetical protein